MPGRGLIPVGVYEGSPCIELTEAAWDPNDPEKLVHACLEAYGPGIDLINVAASLPWGSAELEYALGLVLQQPALEGIRLWRLCSFDDERWSNLRADTALNATQVLYEPNVRAALHGYQQWPQEVVILEPCLDEVKFEKLDDILGWTQAFRGYIYTGADPLLLLPELARCATCWAVRKY